MDVLENITYRIFCEDDMPGVMELWEKHSDWGKITEDQFRKWYFSNPYDPCIVAVACLNQKEIVGQIILVPTRILIENNYKWGVKISSPIIHRQIRLVSIQAATHPLCQLVKTAFKQAIESGYQVGYLHPLSTWGPLLKHFPKFGLPPVNIKEFGCVVLDAPHTGVDGIRVELHQGNFGDEFDQLWSIALRQFSVCIERSAKWLRWKAGGHDVLKAYREDGQLIGYVICKKGRPEIIDILATHHQTFQETLQAVCFYGKQNRQYLKYSCMNIPALQSCFENFTYTQADFKFLFGSFSLSSEVANQQIETSNWFTLPND